MAIINTHSKQCKCDSHHFGHTHLNDSFVFCMTMEQGLSFALLSIVLRPKQIDSNVTQRGAI